MLSSPAALVLFGVALFLIWPARRHPAGAVGCALCTAAGLLVSLVEGATLEELAVALLALTAAALGALRCPPGEGGGA